MKRSLCDAPLLFVFGCGFGLVGGLTACISTESDLLDSAEDCPEFTPGEPLSDDSGVDETVRHFMQAASDFSVAGRDLSADVLQACAAIALDLGSEDTWSQFDDLERSIANPDGTGACDVALERVEELLIEAEEVDAQVAIAISQGECHVSFEDQVACDTECAIASCEPGTIETRCSPGDLSVQCEASCEAGATCEGTAEVPANCMGSCQAECVGECTGLCFADDGTITEDDPNCVGKCSSSCNGKCTGECEIEAAAGIECGAEVSCTGGCTGSFTEPECVSEFTPPSCEIDAECHAACSARLLADAECDPTEVDVIVDVTETPALEPLVETLEANLPTLLEAGEREGVLAANAAKRLHATGTVIIDDLDDLDGKSLSCLKEASQELIETVSLYDISVDASASVTVTTSSQTH